MKVDLYYKEEFPARLIIDIENGTDIDKVTESLSYFMHKKLISEEKYYDIRSKLHNIQVKPFEPIGNES